MKYVFPPINLLTMLILHVLLLLCCFLFCFLGGRGGGEDKKCLVLTCEVFKKKILFICFLLNEHVQVSVLIFLNPVSCLFLFDSL